MRILAITNLYPNPFQPYRAPFNRQQFRAISERHAIQVISPIAWTEEFCARRAGKVELSPNRRAVCDGITVDHPAYFFPPKVLRPSYGHFFRRCIKRSFDRALREFRPDVVLGCWAYPDGWATVELAHGAGLPAVVKVHGSDVHMMSRYLGREKQTIETLKRADGIIAVSRDLSETIAGFGVEAAKIRTIYNGVDTTLFHPGKPGEDRAKLGIESDIPVLLYAGNLRPVKGVDVLIEACAHLAAEGFPFVCYIIGDGPQRGALERQVASLGLDGRVKLVGAKPHHDLPNWFRAASAFVLPSHSEGVPNVLLEASACGTPFVATRVGGIPEIVHLGNGQLVPAANPRAMAEAIRACVSCQSDRSTARSRQFRGHANTAAEMESCLAEACGRYHWQNGRAISRSREDDRGLKAHSPIASSPSQWRQFTKAALARILPRRLFILNGPQELGTVCLTFDDGPHPQHTPRILDLLREFNVTGTFFLVGKRMRRHPELVRRIVAEGHAVGHHTFFHSRPDLTSTSRLMLEIRRTDALFIEILGHSPRLFRPPLGKLTPWKFFRLLSRGVTVVLWNQDPKDWNCRKADEVREWFRSHPLNGGDIVLLHDWFPHSAEVLPEIINGTRARGLNFTSVRAWTGDNSVGPRINHERVLAK
ncbi:MAG: tuaC [Phycisphaerales bacterium]|nr:tuaC [Phycisphaerales bacterium]